MEGKKVTKNICAIVLFCIFVVSFFTMTYFLYKAPSSATKMFNSNDQPLFYYYP